LYGPAAATPPVRRGFRDEWPARLWRTLSFRPTLAFVAAVLFAVVIGVISEWATLRGPTVWTSRTVMLVDEPYGIATSGDEGLLLKLTSVRYKYQGLAATSVIDGPVANSLGLPVAVVEGSTSVVVPPDSLLMDVYAQWSRPAEAQRLSAAVANEIASFVQSEGATYKVPANEQFTISVVDAATPAVASGPSHSKAASVAIAAALAALFVGFVLIQLVRNRGLAP
jgi:capsular polysaccharide biosynthesis protein